MSQLKLQIHLELSLLGFNFKNCVFLFLFILFLVSFRFFSFWLVGKKRFLKQKKSLVWLSKLNTFPDGTNRFEILLILNSKNLLNLTLKRFFGFPTKTRERESFSFYLPSLSHSIHNNSTETMIRMLRSILIRLSPFYNTITSTQLREKFKARREKLNEKQTKHTKKKENENIITRRRGLFPQMQFYCAKNAISIAW